MPARIYGYDATLTLRTPDGQDITVADFLNTDALSMGVLQVDRRAVLDAITAHQNADRYDGTVDVLPEDVAYVERIR